MRASKETSTTSVMQVNNAGIALNQIITSVENISGVNHMIAAASEEQGVVAEEINRSVISITDIAVETVEDTEEITAASENLKNLSLSLNEIVQEFKLI